MPKGGRRAHSGRKPKPTELKVLQGSFRDDRHGEEAQPAQKGWPEPPAHLSDREKTLWDGLKTHCEPWSAKSDWLAFNGVVSLTDRILRVQEAMAVGEAGAPLAFKYSTDGDGNQSAEPKENPLFLLELKCWRELRAFIAITGLSPSDRARMRVVGEDKPANPLDRFVKKAK